jgi:hypothetical protein
VEKKIILQVKRIPDGYRGDLSCLKVVSPHETGRIFFEDWDSGSSDYKEEILVDGKLVAILHQIHGNGGFGADAATKIYPEEGVVVEYV